MAIYAEKVTKEDVSTSALEVILPPRDLQIYPRKTLTFENAATGAALADCEVELGPTSDGPWLAEDLTGTGIPTLAAGASAAYRMEKVDRYLRVRAQAAGANCDLSVHVNAVG